MKIKKMLVTVLILIFVLCTFSACGTKPENKILGKWYNEKGDCLEILSDNTYSIDKIYTGYEIGINSGEWEYLEEGFFKFYANDYEESVIKIVIDKDKNGQYIKYTYYGTFYKKQYPMEHIEEITDSGDNSTSTKLENSQVSPNTEETNESTQTQTQTNQSKPTSTTNQPIHTHSYSNATCTSPKKCSCGATAGTALGHQFSTATCTSPKICSRCGTTSGNALGHSYSAANCNSPKTCTRCGQTEGSALGHNYVNNKCSRCGKVDPDSLPVGLESVHLIDSHKYQYKTGTFTDSFGNIYNGVHYITDLYENCNGREPHATFNINGKYSTFSGSIVAATITEPEFTYYINIYVDNVLKFSKKGFSKTSGKVDFKIDIKNASTLKITAGIEQTMGDWHQEIGIVNAQLIK